MKTIDKILARFKEIVGASSDYQLAKYLNIQGAVISNWRKRERIPFEKIYEFCTKNDFSIDWVLTGKGNRKLENDDSAKIEQVHKVLPELDEKIEELYQIIEKIRMQEKK
jgi:predicted transcriptional regulator